MKPTLINERNYTIISERLDFNKSEETKKLFDDINYLYLFLQMRWLKKRKKVVFKDEYLEILN